MVVTCTQCNTAYRLTNSEISENGRKVRCIFCGHMWHQMPENEEKSFSENTLNLREKGGKKTKDYALYDATWLKVLAFISVMFLGLVVFFTFRESFPIFLKPLYQKVGIYETSMLKLKEVSVESYPAETAMNFIVSATILNSAKELRIAPSLKIAFLDKDKALLKDIYFASSGANFIKPGETYKAVKMIKNAPGNAKQLIVDIINPLEALMVTY